MENVTNSLKFSPGPAAPMGFGNVDIALALAESALRPNAAPPAATLRDKLLEILGKRAAGDGWGKIARSYGLQLQE